jgi:hypothetical protein
MSDNDNKNCFNPLQYTSNSCSSCWEAIDSTLPASASDAERGDQCAKECQWLCWPVIFTFDIASCPFRGAYFCQQRYCNCSKCSKCSKCSCKKVTCCKVYPTVSIQPI